MVYSELSDCNKGVRVIPLVEFLIFGTTLFTVSRIRRRRKREQESGQLGVGPLLSSSQAPDRPLNALEKAAVLLMATPADISAGLFKELGADTVEVISLAIAGLPQLSSARRVAVIEEFLEVARQLSGSGSGPNRSPQQLWEELARDCPDLVAKLLRGLWLSGSEYASAKAQAEQQRRQPFTPPASLVDTPRRSQGGTPAGPPDNPNHQKAAILLMSLPPEASAQLFKELGPEAVKNVTLVMSRLPSITTERRSAVLNEFIEVAARLSGGSASSVTDPVAFLEGVARQHPDICARLIVQLWMTG